MGKRSRGYGAVYWRPDVNCPSTLMAHELHEPLF
jgi:hypothetical protein